jgi:predicted Zn-dependent protease
LAGIDWATSDAIDARHAVEQLKFSYARESGDWSVYGGHPPDWTVVNPKITTDRATTFKNYEIYRIALVAALLGDTARAKSVVDSLPERSLIGRAQVGGLVAKARGDTTNWLGGLEAAAKADEMVPHFGPPSVYPPHELLGDALLAVGRPKDAIAAYEKGLELMPNRSLTLLGLARAQRATGDTAGATRTEARLRENWRRADAPVSSKLAAR